MAKFNNKKEPTKTIKNAIPILAYLDIFKNYYANKQESNYYYLVKSAYVNTTFTNREITYDQTGKLTTGYRDWEKIGRAHV